MQIAIGAQGIFCSAPVLDVAWCDVPGGQAGVSVPTGTLQWGPGNLHLDPLFADPDGPDEDPLTFLDNDYRLAAGSPCIDAGGNLSVPPDLLDLDGDGDTGEPTPIDLAGAARFADDPAAPDVGNGTAPLVDLGAYERPRGRASRRGSGRSGRRGPLQGACKPLSGRGLRLGFESRWEICPAPPGPADVHPQASPESPCHASSPTSSAACSSCSSPSR